MTGGRVMIVDDEDEIRELCRVNLEFDNFEVLEAPDGPTALELAHGEPVDLILLDLMMPGMDGWEVLSRLKEDPVTAEIPVVLLTAKGDERDQMRGWEEGILDYVQKPFNPVTLGQWARQAIDARRDPQLEAERRERIIEKLRMIQELRRSQ